MLALWRPGADNMLTGRFMISGANATQPWVVVMDDDILPSQEALDNLINAFEENPNRIVGKWGRKRHVLWVSFRSTSLFFLPRFFFLLLFKAAH